MAEYDDPKNPDNHRSLADFLKTSKSDAKAGSSLRAPRQSAQQAGAAEPETPEEPSGAPRKDSFLKAPVRNRAQHDPTREFERESAPARPPTHEELIVAAIRKGDTNWVEMDADPKALAPDRQEILFVFALPTPPMVHSLFLAGLRFNPKDGLAVRTAIAKKHYGALEVLKTHGARIDLDTLKAMATWRRSQAKNTAAPSGSPAKLQESFEQFLMDHGKEIDPQELSAFAPAPAEPEPEPLAPQPLEEPAAAQAVQAEAEAEPATQIEPRHGAPADALASAPEAEADPVHHALPAEEQHPPFDLPEEMPLVSADPQLPPAREKKTPVARAIETEFEQPVDNRAHTPLEPAMAAPTPSPTPAADARKSAAAGGGLSPLVAARLAMLDKVVAEKQQLEMRVLELEMYADAAGKLEDERNNLLDELADAQDGRAALAREIDSLKTTYSSFGKTKADLEEQLAAAQDAIKNQEQEHNRERDRLSQAEANLASLLRDGERRETELRAHNEQLAAKIEELGSRTAPLPEVVDWLRDTAQEAGLRKQMFIDAVIKGEHKTLDKIAKNTAVESELAHLALAYAAEAGQIKCAQWIVDNLDVHPGFGNEIALHRAVEAKHHDMIRWLSNNGADIHRADEFALRMAVEQDNVGLMDFLVTLGANPRVASERPLREAAAAASWHCFKALLGYGCVAYDEKGDLYPEIAAQEETLPLIEWADQQRKAAKALDPDFSKRQKRRDF